MSIPRSIVRAHQDIVKCTDIMYVNTILFLITISRVIKFPASQDIPNQTKYTYVRCIKLLIQVYRNARFIVCMFLIDHKFECLREALLLITPPVKLNVTSELEHVPEIERSNWIMKKRMRDERTTLPYRYMPQLMIKSLVNFQTLWLNAFPVKLGASTMVSPKIIMTQK